MYPQTQIINAFYHSHRSSMYIKHTLLIHLLEGTLEKLVVKPCILTLEVGKKADHLKHMEITTCGESCMTSVECY